MIPLFKVFMDKNVGEEVNKVLYSGMITQASKVEEFESMCKKWFNYPYIVTLNSCTSGLTLALYMLNLNKEEEVLTSALTCTATNWPILTNGLNIKWVDVDDLTCNMNLTDLENKITEKTKALILIHWAGIPNDLDSVNQILDRAEQKYGFRIKIIEDCAHAFGAEYKNKKLGTSGNMSVFSLQAIKHITTGDGGLLFLPNEEMYNRAKLLRWFGIDKHFRSNGKDFRMEPDITEHGFKYHMNDINATIGICNLPNIDWMLNTIRSNASYYYSELKDCKHTTLLDIHPESNPAWWIFTLKVKNRDNFIEYAARKGIMVSQVHKRNDVHTCVQQFKTILPVLDILEKTYVSVPVGWWVTKDDRNRIVTCVKNWDIVCDIKIRQLVRSDYCKGYLRLYKQLNGIDIQLSEEEFNNKITDEYWVVEYKDCIIGCGKLIIEEKMYSPVARIEDIICDIEYRRIGISSVLIHHFMQLSKEKSCYKVVLNAKEHNASFYKSLGFSSDNTEYKIYLNKSG